jgi:hypothetical protein
MGGFGGMGGGMGQMSKETVYENGKMITKKTKTDQYGNKTTKVIEEY